MIRIALCDDDSYVCTALKDCLTKYQVASDEKIPFNFELRYFSTSKELLETDYNYEILFLDIMLEDDKNGIEIGKLLRTRRNKADIILLTSLASEAIRGYTAKVLRFFLKPVKDEDIEEVLNYIRFERAGEVNELKVTFRRITRMIPFRDIQHIHTYYRQTELVTESENIRCSETLDQLAGGLPPSFCRTSKSFIVNFKYVQELSKTGIRMKNDVFIPFQRGNSGQFTEVNQLFNQYILEEQEYV